MAAQPLPSPKPGPTGKKTPPTEITTSSLQKHLNVVLKKRWLRIGGIALASIVLILIVLPLLINVNSFRPKVESEASAALGRQVTVANLSLSILSGSVRADNIAIADDPAFSKSPFVTAKSLKVGVEMVPLIFSKKLNVTDITLDEPQITLLKAANGKWNFSTLGGTSPQKAPGPAKSGGSAPGNFSVAKLKVNHGKLSVGKANSSTKPAVYDNVNITVSNFSFTSQFPFQLTAQLPGSGDVNIAGKAGPIGAEDAAKTPLGQPNRCLRRASLPSVAHRTARLLASDCLSR